MLALKVVSFPYRVLTSIVLVIGFALLMPGCSNKQSSEGGAFDNARRPLKVEVGTGCWPREGTDTANHHWCGAQGQISITNPGTSDTKVELQGLFATQTYPGVLTVEDPGIDSKFPITKNATPWKFEVPVKPGVTQVRLQCDCKQVVAAQDPRFTYFNIVNFQYHEVENR